MLHFKFETAHADKGYDYRRCRAYLKAKGILCRIARRGVESSQRLGKHRWVVERTHAWFAGFGKLRIRFERRLDMAPRRFVWKATSIMTRLSRALWAFEEVAAKG